MKIVKDGITSKSQLPSGTIVKTTDTTKPSGYAEYGKDAFEDDGSLIAIFAPTEETVAAYKREVKIKWESGGKFTTYSFDLRNAELLPLIRAEVGDSVTDCQFNGDITSAEFKHLADEAWERGVGSADYSEHDGLAMIQVSGTVGGQTLNKWNILWLKKVDDDYILHLSGEIGSNTTIYDSSTGYANDFTNMDLYISWDKDTYKFSVLAPHELEVSMINDIFNGRVFGNVE